jgi:sec-independent protein translocase protein TatB
VALVVIGPERLPKVARTLGHLYGRPAALRHQVKADIHREMETAELGKMKNEFESAARSFQGEVDSGVRDIDREVREAQASIEAIARRPSAGGQWSHGRRLQPPRRRTDPPSPQLELGIEAPPAPPNRAAG